MLTGTELLAKVKELGDVSKSDLVRACGYVSDKKGGDKEKFQLAATANKNKDFGQLLEMADELEIDIELSNELIDEMTKQCNAVVNNITKIKTTTAWTWAHCHPQEKDGLKEYILSTMAPPKDLTEEKTKN